MIASISMTVLPDLFQKISCELHIPSGAHDQDRTGDLVLTKDALCRLSYVG
jgi:hypothetical protein